MEINITSILRDVDTWPLSGSIVTHGPNAGAETWAASKAQAKETPLLDTEEKLDAMRDFARSSGGWTREEIEAWDDDELNALFLQWVAGDLRELGADECDFEDIPWDEIEERQREGQAPSNIYRGGEDQVFFYLGS